MNTSLHFSSQTCEWTTPQALFDAINAVCQFELDVCATDENAKCARYYTIATDGLSQEWPSFSWMNPPYGRTIAHWIRKAFEESRKGKVIVGLVPAKTDTHWWHRYCISQPVLYVCGRLKFSGHKYNAPFGSAIVLFGGTEELRSRLQQHLTAAGWKCG